MSVETILQSGAGSQQRQGFYRFSSLILLIDLADVLPLLITAVDKSGLSHINISQESIKLRRAVKHPIHIWTFDNIPDTNNCQLNCCFKSVCIC